MQTIEILPEDLDDGRDIRQAVERRLSKAHRERRVTDEQIIFVEGEDLTPCERELLRKFELEREFGAPTFTPRLAS